ncbi:hypothetical protein PDESU_01641 [Pontiella desulfatans]|uniref:Uncharacterized protein n=1 Tax=Pontiella desulfatans TaxID=2750659 RepID=A0A6C2TZP1_PONDE|nr:extracellular solute-binding protein [Pontiella desulfatans]VGO13087.1 hypothetical protein PDESU_01641 [Pontiella desulfatans]
MIALKNINIKAAGAWLLAALLLTGFWHYTDPARKTSEKGQVLIRFWNGFTGPDGRSIIKLAETFNKQNPDVKVLVQRMDWGTYYNKLFVAGLGGRAPEVFILHATMVPRFKEAGFLSPLETDPALADDIDERVWSSVFHDGRQWAVPLDILPMGMFCNRTLFREAGLTNQLGEVLIPTNRKEVLDAMRRLTKDTDGDGKTDQWGHVISWVRLNWQSIVAQMDGKLVSADGKTCTVDAPENVAAMQFFIDLVEKEKVCPKPEGFDSWVGFLQGKVGIVFEGIWMLPELQKSDLDFQGAAFPTLGKHPGVWGDSHVMCLAAQIPAREKEAALRFMIFLSDNSLEWAKNGPIPVRKSIRATPEFQAMETQSAFAERIPDLEYSPMVPYKLELDAELDIAAERAIRRSVSPLEAFSQAGSNIQKVIERGGAE